MTARVPATETTCCTSRRLVSETSRRTRHRRCIAQYLRAHIQRKRRDRQIPCHRRRRPHSHRSQTSSSHCDAPLPRKTSCYRSSMYPLSPGIGRRRSVGRSAGTRPRSSVRRGRAATSRSTGVFVQVSNNLAGRSVLTDNLLQLVVVLGIRPALHDRRGARGRHFAGQCRAEARVLSGCSGAP